LETVSLDLYLARELGLFARNFPALSTTLDAVALLDEFAYRFYQELDYNLECDNGNRIRREMSVLPMVVIPKNFPQYTSRRVHVAEWIEGEKLSQSTADDVGALVNLGVITYLTQLLDSGFFHADPHPGRDYSEIGQDFINLDFIPKGTDTTPIVPALTKVFDVALAGGGAKSINFQELAADLAEITFEYPFRIPPYFALVIRAISVLEGIALVGNPQFAIIDEAYPYIARRLMTDDNPRLTAALRYMVYGPEDSFDAEKLIDLLQALEKFTAVRDEGDGSAFKVDGVRGTRLVGAAGDFRGSQKVDISDRDVDVAGGKFRITNASGRTLPPVNTQKARDEATVRQALRFFFSPEGKVLREFMLEEIVTVLDASGRGAIQELQRSLGLGNLPMPALFRALNPELTQSDRKIVEQIRVLIQFLLGDFNSATQGNQRLRNLIPVVREYSSDLRDFGTLLLARLTEKSISRGLNYVNSRLSPVSRV
jgi:aarF domain-containing kinase